jgi:hypothetical protein
MLHASVLVSLMVLLCLGAVGCGSIYHDTQVKLPPEPFAQLKFRIVEAQRAEQLARQSITKLRDQLNSAPAGEAVAQDVDRVVTATFEFERRVAAVQEAAAHCEGQTQFVSEIKRLQRRANELLEYGQALRRGGSSINAHQLDELLQGSTRL